MRLRAAIVFFSFLSFPQLLCAENDPLQESSALAKLASPKDENPSGTVISSANMADFASLLPRELITQIQSAELALSALRSLRVAGNLFDEGWKKKSAELVSNQDGIEKFADSEFPRGFPYAQKDGAADEAALTAAVRTERFLWNSQAHTASFASLNAEFSLSEMGIEHGISLRGDVQRILPKKFRSEDKTKQLFRERFRIHSPEVVQGLTWLTFRFYDRQDDVVWVYSPAIKKTRQLTNSNRSDPFLDTPFSLDDLFGVSSKIQTLEGAEISEGLFLAPFFGLDVLSLRPDEPQCFVAAPQRKERVFKEILGQPSVAVQDMTFVPRKLLRLELLQHDPYSEYGRQIIYLDAELFLPFYKFVYNRSGVLQKAIITSFATFSTTQLRVWLPMSTYIKNIVAKRAAIVSYDKIRFCQQGDTTVAMGTFEPKGLVQAVEVKSAPASANFQVTLRAPQPTVPGATKN